MTRDINSMTKDRVVRIEAPISRDALISLKVGQEVLISGSIYTARDAAHKRLFDAIESKKRLPIDLKDQVIYYTGPTPSRPGHSGYIGAAGPTSSYRMDPYTSILFEQGLGAVIGKGPRSTEVIEAIIKNKGVYFIAIGGLGALISKHIKKAEVVAYEDLETEAIWRFYVDDFPVIVANDILGDDIYKHPWPIGHNEKRKS